MTTHVHSSTSVTAGVPIYNLPTQDDLIVTDSGILVGDDASPVRLSSENQVRVDGAIYAYGFAAIWEQVAGGNNSISVGSDGLIYSDLTALHLIGAYNAVENRGEISAKNLALYADGIILDNSGLVYGESNAVYMSGSLGGTITNSGLIQARTAIWGSSDVDVVVNTGLIVGLTYLWTGNDSLTNSGEMQGDVSLGDGADSLRSAGEIFGNVLLDAGADSFDGRNGLMDGYYVSGGDGDDKIKGGAGEDDFRGDAGADTLTGKGGDDVLAGGKSGDRLIGGAGADSFHYGLSSDSYPAKQDTIVDFSRTQGDVIDLSQMDANSSLAGNQAFDFIGTAAFSAAGQLRYGTGGGNATLSGDLDGDGAADFSILLLNLGALGGGDFVL